MTHLVVVDPGVGTDRDALVVRAGDHTLVGPDNGVLLPAARRLAGEPERLDPYLIDEDGLGPVEPTTSARADASTRGQQPPQGRSETFHGRDVFAPAAAAVHEIGVEALAELEWLTPTTPAVDLELPTPTLEDETTIGEVLVVDDFGNVITNVPGSRLEDRDQIRANGEPVPVGETFAAVPVGERLATVGSHGYVELDVNQGRGDETFGLEPGDRIVLEPADGDD